MNKFSKEDHTYHVTKEELERHSQALTKKETRMDAHHQDYHAAIQERYQPSVSCRSFRTSWHPTTWMAAASKVLTFDSKKVLNLKQLVERFQVRRCVAILMEWQQMEWLVKVETRPMARIFIAVQIQIVSDDIKARLFALVDVNLSVPTRILLLRSRCSAIWSRSSIVSRPLPWFQW